MQQHQESQARAGWVPQGFSWVCRQCQHSARFHGPSRPCPIHHKLRDWGTRTRQCSCPPPPLRSKWGPPILGPRSWGPRVQVLTEHVH